MGLGMPLLLVCIYHILPQAELGTLPCAHGRARLAASISNSSASMALQGNDIVEVPKSRLAEGSVDPDLAYQIIHDELMLEARALPPTMCACLSIG
jgi:hypothetical protein